MFKKNPRHRLIFLIFMILVLVADSVMNFLEYAETHKGMKLTGGIVFGAMAIFFIDELVTFYKNKKSINRGA
ncbi:MAG TPA: hypothetical protein PLZ45_14485 [Ferruginibacter sp.]|nr:hypothetical protein [Ferruginibacter sp.]